MLEAGRVIKIVKTVCSSLDLNLNGLNVLTEVGSNSYSILPVIAAFAGAKVFAWTRDSSYGKAVDNISQCRELLECFGLVDKVEFYIGELNKEHLQEADIITNSGFLRPLNAEKLKHAKPGLIIPLMYEEWEFRASEIDLEYCKINDIRVAGTWEGHPSINVFSYVGVLAIKMALNGGFEVKDNNIFIWSKDEFGLEAQKAFKDMKANELTMSTNKAELKDKLPSLDFIFVCDYEEKQNLQKVLDFEAIKKINPSCGIIHLYGEIDSNSLSKSGLHFYPVRLGKAQKMSFTLSEVGLNPIVRLQAAGLKVAESLKHGKSSSLVQTII